MRGVRPALAVHGNALGVPGAKQAVDAHLVDDWVGAGDEHEGWGEG